MKKINWSSKYSVGVGVLDEQHKRLVMMINRLIDYQNAATGSEAISELISEMIKYAQEHFRYEEDLMAESEFPLLNQHKQSHRKFRKKISDLCIAVPLGVSCVPQVMLDFLSKWLLNHILHEDMSYKSFFEEREVL